MRLLFHTVHKIQCQGRGEGTKLKAIPGGLKTELRTTNPQIFQKGTEGKTRGFQGREEFLFFFFFF